MPNKDLMKARKQYVGKARAKRAGAEQAAAMALGQPTGRSKTAGDAVARKRFFIKTRTAELKAAGKKVDVSKLAARYDSGKVKRTEFYAGGKKEAAKRQASSVAKTSSVKTGSAKTFEGKVVPYSKPKTFEGKALPSKTVATKTATSGVGLREAAKMALGQMNGKSSVAPAKKVAPTTTTTTVKASAKTTSKTKATSKSKKK